MKLINEQLATLSYEDIEDLAESVIGLPEYRLMPTWAYIQHMKYNAMILEGDCAQSNIIFRAIELPIIKRLYPEEMVYPKVKKWVSYMAKKTQEYSHEKFQKYLEMRRYGIAIDQARKNIQPIFKKEFLKKMAQEYGSPFRYTYELSCKDADLIFNLGIDRFIQLFYDRFYQPVTIKHG